MQPMAAQGTMTSRDKTSMATARGARCKEPELLPLPWPAPGADPRTARRQHRHRCINCPNYYLCAGPEETGECSPLCGPCLWVELGTQLRMYQSMANAIDRRRRRLEARVGSAACRRAQTMRRNLLRQSNVLAGFGRVVLQREEPESRMSN
jgi:hypothetical protein